MHLLGEVMKRALGLIALIWLLFELSVPAQIYAAVIALAYLALIQPGVKP